MGSLIDFLIYVGFNFEFGSEDENIDENIVFILIVWQGRFLEKNVGQLIDFLICVDFNFEFVEIIVL